MSAAVAAMQEDVELGMRPLDVPAGTPGHDRRKMALETYGKCVTGDDDPDAWYPERLKKETASDYAKELCKGCPVIDLCLEVALENREPHGVWGGTSEDDRRQLAAARAKAVRQRRLQVIEGQQ